MSEPLSEDVAALAKVIEDAENPIDTEPVSGYDELARAVLASDWLAAREAAAAKAAGERALLDVADEWLSEYDGEASHVARFLRDRAARIAREDQP